MAATAVSPKGPIAGGATDPEHVRGHFAGS